MVSDYGSLNKIRWNDGSDGAPVGSLLPYKWAGLSYKLQTSSPPTAQPGNYTIGAQDTDVIFYCSATCTVETAPRSARWRV